MSALSDIYDLETQVESIVVSALTDGGLQAISPESTIELRKERPRVEVTAQLGGAIDTNYTPCPDGVYRHGFYNVTVMLYVLTASREEGQGEESHKFYRAKCREVMSSILTTQAADNIKLRYSVPTGTSGKQTTQEGYEESTLTYSMTFEIKAEAWPT